MKIHGKYFFSRWILPFWTHFVNRTELHEAFQFERLMYTKSKTIRNKAAFNLCVNETDHVRRHQRKVNCRINPLPIAMHWYICFYSSCLASGIESSELWSLNTEITKFIIYLQCWKYNNNFALWIFSRNFIFCVSVFVFPRFYSQSCISTSKHLKYKQCWNE